MLLQEIISKTGNYSNFTKKKEKNCTINFFRILCLD